MRDSIKLLAGLVILSAAGSLYAEIIPNYEREARLAAEAEAGLFEGEPIYFNSMDREFLGIYAPADQSDRGAVILLHGRGFHPDWPQVTGPLREGLTDNGITTLSLQMPVLAKDAKYYDYLEIIDKSFPRIAAGIEFLHAEGYNWIAVIAHSCSVHMTMAWLREFGDSKIDAYVGIGMEATDYGQPMHQPFPLERLSIPMLDVFGSADYPAVIAGAPARFDQITKAGNSHSKQMQIDGPDHFFEGYEDELIDAVDTWLQAARSVN